MRLWRVRVEEAGRGLLRDIEAEGEPSYFVDPLETIQALQPVRRARKMSQSPRPFPPRQPDTSRSSCFLGG